MDEKTFLDTLNVILDPGNPKDTSPSGAVIELIRSLCKESKVKEIPNVLNKYCKVYPSAAGFLRGRIPALLVENYFIIREDLNFEDRKSVV